MHKATWHYWLDLSMGLVAVLLAISSFLLWVVFPRGYSAARTAWVLIHKWSGLALGVLVLLHVVLHWQWLARMTRRELGRLTNRVRDDRRFDTPHDSHIMSDRSIERRPDALQHKPERKRWFRNPRV